MREHEGRAEGGGHENTRESHTKRVILQFPTTEAGGRRRVFHPFPLPLFFFFSGIGGVGVHGSFPPRDLAPVRIS